MLSMSKEKKIPLREYPPFYEKIVPVLLGILIVIVVGVLLAAIGVALGAVS